MADFPRADRFKQPPLRDSHAERRQTALDLQRNRRAAVVEQHRRDAQWFEDLDLADSFRSTEPELVPENGGGHVHPTFGTAAPSTSHATQGGRPQKDKFKRFSNLLAWGSLLSASQPLPEDLTAFLYKPLPLGKRCLLVTYPTRSGHKYGKSSSHNALLLHRSSGHPICRALVANCPPGCMLDCTYDEAQQCLWLLDVLEWHSTTMTESEATFRFWWLESKFQELGAQPFQLKEDNQSNSSSRDTSNTRRLVLAHVPCGALSGSVLAAASEPQQTVCVDILDLSENAPSSFSSSTSSMPQTRRIELSLTSCGWMLYHAASFYVVHKEHVEQDVCPLLYWVPHPPTHLKDALDVHQLLERLQQQPHHTDSLEAASAPMEES